MITANYRTHKRSCYNLNTKKDSDRRLNENWRPISLVNVDVKIGSKAIAKRLEKVLPYIIHQDQNAFVKGRTLCNAVRTINDIMDFTEMEGCIGIILPSVLKKHLTLLGYTFWIRIFYKNIRSCVFNNGCLAPSSRLNEKFIAISFYYSSRIVSNFHEKQSLNKSKINGIILRGIEIKLAIFF